MDVSLDQDTSPADVVIVGGGPVGAACALGLAAGGKRVILCEARAEPADDARTLALSRGTALILNRLGVDVDQLGATPITTIHVSQRGGFGQTRISAQELDVPALGYVISYAALAGALDARLAASSVEVHRATRVTGISLADGFARVDAMTETANPAFRARLVALADGGKSLDVVPAAKTRQVDYAQSAVVGLVSVSPLQAGTAFERFTPEGPAALLPVGQEFALVWTATPDRADVLMQMGDAEFLAALAEHMGFRDLRFTAVRARNRFPLSLRFANPVQSARTVMIGNAAQALHPVAGQGFNLGIRDAHDLAQLVIETPAEQLGGAAMLSRYAASRRLDAGAGIAVTDFMVRGFSNDLPLLREARGLALTMLDVLPPAKRWFARKMMFGAGG